MKIANADKLKKHFENVVDVKLFTVPEICTIIDRFSMNMAIADDEKMLSLNEEYVIVPSLEESEWVGINEYLKHLEEETGELYKVSKLYDGSIFCKQCWKMNKEKSCYCPNCGAWMVGGTRP